MPRNRPSDARSWVRSHYRGYFAALYTPFGTDGEVDHPALARNVEITLQLPGVCGLSLNSIHQEFWTLTDTERLRLTETVLRTVDSRKPVIVGVSHTSSRTVVEFARHAAAVGADAVMVWPPYYGSRSTDGVRAFYEYVAERIDIGMFAYSTTLSELGFYLTPEMVEALLPLENLCGVHSSTMNIASYASMLERVGAEIAVSTSLEEYFLFGKLSMPERTPDFLMGCSRPLFVQTRDKPHCGRFIEAALSGDFVAAAKEARTILTLAEKLQSRYFARGYHNVSLSKALSENVGLTSGPVRPPASAAEPADLAECFELLREAGLR
ncbi:dihydrodipicolinate synthase family protein [uncultured Enterovirga sp.]|uniref:dihydrodipicolinate synthase family protein n=1 Tax=uncultured Enterovirga sp. TaxID=2026352 RepID=UPI0035CB4556